MYIVFKPQCWGSEDKRIPRACWDLSLFDKLQVSGRSCLNKKRCTVPEDWHLRLSFDFYYTQTHTRYIPRQQVLCSELIHNWHIPVQLFRLSKSEKLPYCPPGLHVSVYLQLPMFCFSGFVFNLITVGITMGTRAGHPAATPRGSLWSLPTNQPSSWPFSISGAIWCQDFYLAPSQSCHLVVTSGTSAPAKTHSQVLWLLYTHTSTHLILSVP